MIASLLIIAILISTIAIPSSPSIIILSLSLFILFFPISSPPLLSLILPQLFPIPPPPPPTPISPLLLNIPTLILSFFFPILTHPLTTQSLFLIFPFIPLLPIIFLIKFLPQTPPPTLEQIQYQLPQPTPPTT
ncbi:MFS transporter, partial [Staphylococcus epidermidis]|uniref:MFS transporter n=1 Tax=Staphylococcus epidermidis TaxID=1282 RepID=UPI00119DC330